MADVRQKTIEHLQCTHAALDAAKRELDKQAAARTKAAALIPKVVEVLVQHARLDPKMRKEAEAALADPVRALEILIKAADPANTTQPKPLGKSANGNGAAPRVNPNYAGEVYPQGERESDRIWRERLSR